MWLKRQRIRKSEPSGRTRSATSLPLRAMICASLKRTSSRDDVTRYGCEIALVKVFNYRLYRLHTGCQWMQLPIAPSRKDPEKKRPCRTGSAEMDIQAPRRSGRPRTDAEVECLVLQLARTNDWGNGKIAGELLKLGIDVSDQTTANSLKRHGISPLPQRRPSLSWRHLMTHYKKRLLHLRVILDCLNYC